MSVRWFSTPEQINAVLGTRAPAIADRAGEIFEVITRAREEFKRSQTDAEQTSTPSLSIPISASATTALSVPQSTAPIDDVWADLTTKPAAKSSLFGSTIRSKATPTQLASSGKTSGLFGPSTIRASFRPESAVFDDVRRKVHEALAPALPTSNTSEQIARDTAAKPAPTSQHLSADSSSFNAISVDDDATETTKSVATPAEEGPSPPKRAKRDEIVQVKKKAKKARHVIDATSLPTSSESSSAPSSVKGQAMTPKKASKKQAASGAIPEFDYTKAPNLLDNPKSGSIDAGKKKKKEKKERKGMPSILTE